MCTIEVGEYFKYLLANKSKIEQNLSIDHLNPTHGLCHNVVEYTDDTFEYTLQNWFLEYFNKEEYEDIPDYPFGKGSRDTRRKTYMSYQGENLNMYGTDDYGKYRWDFIQFVVNKVSEKAVL